MIRALKLEWLKIRNYRTFWVLVSMYCLALMIICFGGMFLLEYLKSLGADFEGLDPTILPIYDFPDIWQNMTYLGTFLKILLAFIVIISVNNDQSYNTLRQNIIDGISKKEYILGKLLLIGSLALVSTLFLFISGLINGLMYSHVSGVTYIFDELEFLFAYWYDIVIFCTLAMLLSLVIKKAGFVIIALTLYTLMFEPIAGVIMTEAPFMKNGIWPYLAPFLPIHALNDMIPIPFPKYMFQEIVDNIPTKALVISTGWFTIYLVGIHFILTRRDLKA
ncbi:ABC transporter permease subunit [Marinoscillum sp.]|uniref:ABC transporter permease subunit n=1 Tax=Marinoscillum sp. TaxID=2024838 RepID=UPI003BA9A8BF